MSKEERNGKLKIGVKDFGPISSGSVDLKPLTVLIGPNNSEKSYFAMLVHSIFQAVVPIRGQAIMAYPFLIWRRKKERTVAKNPSREGRSN